MDVKMEVNLRNVQERATDSAQQVKSASYRATLTYLGIWGLGYDFAKEMVETGKDLLDKAELRGEEMVRDLNAQADKYSEQATDEAKKVASLVSEQVDSVSSIVVDNTKSLEGEVENVLRENPGGLWEGFREWDVAPCQGISIRLGETSSPDRKSVV